MKYIVTIALCVTLLFTLDSCNNNPAPASTVAVNDTVRNMVVVPDTISDGCTGGLPNKSVVDSIKYPNRTFHYTDRTGFNDFITAQGDNISIIQTNCEYATFQFVILTDRFSADTSAKSYWADAMASIIDPIRPALKIPIEIDSGLIYLKRFYPKDSDNVKEWGETIIFASVGGDFNSTITINSVEKVGKKYKLAVTFNEGPL